MSTFYLGWGGVNEGAPMYTPYLRTNEEANSYLFNVFGHARFGLDLADGDTPEVGAPMQAVITFTPVGGGADQVRTVDLLEGGDYAPDSGFRLLNPESDDNPYGNRAQGVYRITATVDGLPVANVLYLTVTDGGYGVASWYAEDEAPEPVAQFFWALHRNTREVV